MEWKALDIVKNEKGLGYFAIYKRTPEIEHYILENSLPFILSQPDYLDITDDPNFDKVHDIDDWEYNQYPFIGVWVDTKKVLKGILE